MTMSDRQRAPTGPVRGDREEWVLVREQVWERRLTSALSGDGQEPALVLVEGDAGMGKSRLVHRLLELPRARGVARLVVTFQASGAFVVADPLGGPEPRAGGTEAASPGVRLTACQALEALLASARPALLVAEDLHHADDDCLALLRALLREPPAPFAAALTYRPEQLRSPGLPLGRAVDYPARLSVVRRRLEPLDEE
ncbi:AAA family ATPase, partial [Streptomyces niveus]|uniref:AAA family ATPase n=1 Tax=Streptomyces niveus TaxID=193462 RepID=UPI00114C9283